LPGLFGLACRRQKTYRFAKPETVIDAIASSRHPLFRTAIKVRTETKGLVRKLLSSTAPGRSLLSLYRRVAHERRKQILRTQELKTTFTRYALENSWGDSESLSGAGSSLEATRSLRAALPGLISKLGVRSVLDAPCGDFNWFQHVELPAGVTYIGADVVDELIEANRQKYSNDVYSFRSLDITTEALPRADLWLCRDVLFHFSDRDIFRTLERFANSEIEYILTSCHTEAGSNHDILTGDFRLLNLRLAPFHFPEPEAWIDDWIPGYPVRRMGLWRRAAVVDAVAVAQRPLPTARQ
jgi:hypothetical protein